MSVVVGGEPTLGSGGAGGGEKRGCLFLGGRHPRWRVMALFYSAEIGRGSEQNSALHAKDAVGLVIEPLYPVLIPTPR